MSKPASQAQRAYLRGVAYPILVREVGGEVSDWNEYFLGEYSGWTVIDLFGLKRRKPIKRSTDMTAFEYSGLVEFVIKRAAENGVIVPPPNA